MRIVLLVALAGCPRSPSPPPPSPPPPAPAIAAACPPLGAWTLTTRARCAARDGTLAFTVRAGAPTLERAPLFAVSGTVLASGVTATGVGYETVLFVTDARTTADGCAMTLHLEYVGPHEALRYEAQATVANQRLRGAGTYTYLADDCESEEPERCQCDSPLAIEGTI